MKNLRERYCREKKALSDGTKSGSQASCKAPWPLMSNLEFLDEHLRKRYTISNFDSSQQETTQLFSSSPTNNSTVTTDDGDFDHAFERELFNINIEESQYQGEGQSDESNITSLTNYNKMFQHTEGKGKRKRTAKTPEEVASIGDNLRLIAEASNRFSESMEKRNKTNSRPTSDADAFGEFVKIQLSVLQDDLRDETILKITQIIVT